MTDISFTSSAPSPLFARAAADLNLFFTVTDETALPVNAPPTGFVVTVGPAGSAAPSYIGVVVINGVFSRRYQYRWTVPASPAFSSVGYSITAADANGTPRTVTASSVITIGKHLTRPCIIWISVH